MCIRDRTNAEYPVPEDYTVTLKDVPGTDQTVDERIYEPLMKMLEAMKAEGLSLSLIHI